MRHTLLKPIIGIAALLLAASAFAQDIIVTTAAQKIEAKITEVTKSEVRYKEKDYLDGPTFVISTEEISSIIYANGKVVLYKQAAVPSEPQPEEEPAKVVANESLADILLLSGQSITARVTELKSDHVTYVVGEEVHTLQASQINRVTFHNGQVKAYNTQEPLKMVPQTSGDSATLSSTQWMRSVDDECPQCILPHIDP